MIKAILVLSFFSFSVNAGELQGVTMPEQVEVAGKKLVLNGLGLRLKNKFGFDFKIYVGGLYLSKKMTKAEDIMKDTNPKRIVMHFIYGVTVGKKKLIEGWKDIFPKVCEYDCQNMKEPQAAFYKLMDDMKKKQEIVLDFTKEGISVKTTGRYKKSGMIKNPAFAQNILLAFISDKIPRNKLNTGLLLGMPK